MGRTRGIPALVLATAALASGCTALTATRSGVAGYGSDRGPRLTRPELVARANAICARRARTIAELERPSGGAQTRRFFARVARIERAEFLAFTELRPPPAQERDYTRLLAASFELVGVSERFHAAVVSRDAHARRRALADADRVSTSYDRAARQLGLTCRQLA